jgi:hypothetical protein
MWGMMFGLSLLKLYSYYHKTKHQEEFSIFGFMKKS